MADLVDDLLPTLSKLGIELTPLGPDDPVSAGEIRLRGCLGEGGMGRVYLGLTPGGRPVAVKLVKDPFASDPEFRSRFAREAANAAKVSGIFTAPVLSHDAQAERPWLATAFIPGPNLANAVAHHGTFPTRGVWKLAAGIAEALKAIHAAGITHRDLKPGNILLAADGPRVIDFGISRAEDDHDGQTRTGIRMGTPAYMSPEHMRGEKLGPAADIFALGSVIAYAAGGKLPFQAANDAELVFRIAQGEPDLDAVTDSELRTLIASCLAKDPAARPTPDDVIAAYTRASDVPAADWLPEDLATALTAASAFPEPLEQLPTGDRKRRLAIVGVVTIAAILLGVAIVTDSMGGRRPGIGADGQTTSPAPSGQPSVSGSTTSQSPTPAGIPTPVSVPTSGGGTSPGAKPSKPVPAGPALPNGQLNRGNAVIISQRDNTVLTASSSSKGALVKSVVWRNESGQRWTFQDGFPFGADTVVLRSAPSRYLAYDKDSGGVRLGLEYLSSWEYNSSTGQIRQMDAGLCLTNNGAGKQATLEDCNGSVSQRWKVVS